MAGLFGRGAFTMGKFKQSGEGCADSFESAAEESGSAGSASPGERHAASRHRRKRHKMQVRRRPTRASPGNSSGEGDLHAGDDAGSAAGGPASPAQHSPVLSPSHGVASAPGSPGGGGRGPSPYRGRSTDLFASIPGRSPTCSPRRRAFEEKVRGSWRRCPTLTPYWNLCQGGTFLRKT